MPSPPPSPPRVITTMDSASITQESLLQPLVLGVVVVNFHHQVGPQVEWAHPESLMEDTQLISDLPFYALPDGSNRRGEDLCFFHIHSKATRSDGTTFGVSCNRQVPVSRLTVKSGLTRSTVQKAVVVLSRAPVFQPVRAKLAIVTRVYFDQGDLGDRTLLTDFSHTLEKGLSDALRQSLKDLTTKADTPLKQDSFGLGIEDSSVPHSQVSSLRLLDAALGMGTNLRRFVYEWRTHTLVLLKLVLLQKRVLFYGYPVERLCTEQYSLVACIPGLMTYLNDCAEAETYAPALVPPGTLPLFSGDAIFHPYLPLRQLSLLNAASWLAGTSNPILLDQHDIKIDVIVNLEEKTIVCPYLDGASSSSPQLSTGNQRAHPPPPAVASSRKPSTAALSPLTTDLGFTVQDVCPRSSATLTSQELQQALQLTTADRRWMEEEIIPAVLEDWDASPDQSSTLHFRGSDDWLRGQFQGYITSLLTAVRTAEQADPARSGASPFGTAPPTPVPNLLSPLSPRTEQTDPIKSTAEPPNPVAPQEGASPALTIAHFGRAFCRSVHTTPAYHLWKASTSLDEREQVQHPFESRLTVLEGVSARLSATLDDPRAVLGKSIAASGAALAAGTKGLRRFAATAINRPGTSPELASASDGADDLARSWLLVDHNDAKGSSRVSSPIPNQQADALTNISAAARTSWGSVSGYFSSLSPAPATDATKKPPLPPVRRRATAPPAAPATIPSPGDATQRPNPNSVGGTPRIRVRTRRHPS